MGAERGRSRPPGVGTGGAATTALIAAQALPVVIVTVGDAEPIWTGLALLPAAKVDAVGGTVGLMGSRCGPADPGGRRRGDRSGEADGRVVQRDGAGGRRRAGVEGRPVKELFVCEQVIEFSVAVPSAAESGMVRVPTRSREWRLWVTWAEVAGAGPHGAVGDLRRLTSCRVSLASVTPGRPEGRPEVDRFAVAPARPRS